MTRDSTQPASVSIVIPSCNRRDLLERCLDALTRQTVPPKEVFVIDDCSTDDTPDFLQRFADEHPDFPLHALRNDTPRGANASRNRGIHLATGDIVALLDNDSFAEPDWLEHLHAAFTGNDIAAIVGKVNDADPNNLFDLTLRGTHHVPGPGPARRLVGCNMAVRRDVLLQYILDEDMIAPRRDAHGQPDTATSAGCDEEGIFLRMKAAGLRALAVPGAVVQHKHHYTGRSFIRQAWRGGKSAARLVYKYRLPQRLDMLPFMLGYITLPLALIDIWLLAVPAFFLLMALAAITYNDLFLKRKTVRQTLITFPLLLVYYHVRLAGYIIESLRLRTTTHDVSRVDLSPAAAINPPAQERH